MELVFKMLDWQRQDVLDTLTSLVEQQIPALLKPVLPKSIPLFETGLPGSEDLFNKLTDYCLAKPVQFKDFSITANELNCKFNYMTNETNQDVQVFEFPDAELFDQDLISKHLQSLVFVYSISQTNLSFHI